VNPFHGTRFEKDGVGHQQQVADLQSLGHLTYGGHGVAAEEQLSRRVKSPGVAHARSPAGGKMES
jgi:hypothetical protein